jgi:hypothetical protein
MPYRQNPGVSAGNRTRPDDVDGNGGTKSLQCPLCLSAGEDPRLTSVLRSLVAPDAIPPLKKQPPSAFPAASATASKRDSGDNPTTTRRRQSSIPSVARGPMGPRPLDYGGSLGKRCAWFIQYSITCGQSG